MTTFKELCQNKPSVAVRAMLNGLAAAEKRDDFIINMSTYGGTTFKRRGQRVCVGCAATCAVMQLSGHQFTLEELPPMGAAPLANTFDRQATACGLDVRDLRRFEIAVDDLRSGWPLGLLRYFGCNLEVLDSDLGEIYGWCMDEEWQDAVPEIECYIERLEAIGL